MLQYLIYPRLVCFDWAMKYLLRNKADFDVLEGFLSELLHADVIIESLLESESNSTDGDNKTNRVDLLAKLSDGETVIIEVQCVRQWDFLSRMLYGVSKVGIEHLKQWEPYGNYPSSVGGVFHVYPEYYVIKVDQFSDRVQNKLDQPQRKQYERFLESLRDEKSLIRTHYHDRYDEGTKATEIKFFTAMHQSGLSVEQMAAMTHRSVEDIHGLIE